MVTDIEPCYASATTLVVKVFELRDCLVLDSVAYRSFGMDASPYFEPKTITGAADALRAASSVRHPKPARPVCAKRLRPGASRSRPDECGAYRDPRADNTASRVASVVGRKTDRRHRGRRSCDVRLTAPSRGGGGVSRLGGGTVTRRRRPIVGAPALPFPGSSSAVLAPSRPVPTEAVGWRMVLGLVHALRRRRRRAGCRLRAAR